MNTAYDMVISGSGGDDPLAGMPTEDGFPSEWHRDRYIGDLKREIASCDFQLAEGLVETEARRAELKSARKVALAELKRLGVPKEELPR
jgi:hypothetical protein